MFKKIEIWILYIVIVFFLLFSFIPGFIIYLDFAYDKKIPIATNTIKFIVDLPIKVVDILISRGLNVKVNRPYSKKITSVLKNSDHNFLGEKYSKSMYLLSSSWDHKMQQTVIDFIDLNTFEVKKKIIPDFKEIRKRLDVNNVYMLKDISGSRELKSQAPLLTIDGGLVFQAGAIVKIKSSGAIDWVNAEKKFHHSLALDEEGNIWSPSRNYPFTITNIKHQQLFLEDAITCISPKGKILFDRSLVAIFFKNNIGYKLFKDHGFEKIKQDPFHLNDIEPVLENGKYWKKGDLFLSLRNLSMILLYRPANDSIIWYSEGNTNRQHDIDILNENEISIFNNDSFVFEDYNRKTSNNNITIYNFDTKQFRSYFENSFDKYKIRTPTQGLHTILDSGELYVEESDNGRHLFFDTDGKLVWQIFNYSKETNSFYKYNWSRLIHEKKEIDLLENFLKN